jgi:hypothetical protein
MKLEIYVWCIQLMRFLCTFTLHLISWPLLNFCQWTVLLSHLANKSPYRFRLRKFIVSYILFFGEYTCKQPLNNHLNVRFSLSHSIAYQKTQPLNQLCYQTTEQMVMKKRGHKNYWNKNIMDWKDNSLSFIYILFSLFFHHFYGVVVDSSWEKIKTTHRIMC